MKMVNNMIPNTNRLQNPMYHCLNCGNRLWYRGWCNKKCHTEYLNRKLKNEKQS